MKKTIPCLIFLFILTTPTFAQWQVAILPFENKTGDPQQEWHARGISESVVYAFYKVPQIRLTDETPLEPEWQKAVGNAALMNTKNIHVVIQGWYENKGKQLHIHTDIVEASNSKIRTSIITQTTPQNPQKATAEIAGALLKNLNIETDPTQKTTLQKPISSHVKSYRTTIQAIRTFRRATRQTPPNKTGIDQSETGLNKAIEQDPNNAHAHYYLGRIYELRQNMLTAETTYRKTLSLDFEHVMARYHLAMLFKKQGRSAEALSELEQTLRQSPLNPDIQTAISSLFFSQYEQTFESLTAPLEEMIQAAPDDPTGYYELGNTYDELSRYTEAATYFEQAIERDSTLADAHYKLGLIHHRKGQHEKAVDHLKRAAQHNTQFNRVYFRLGEILYLLKRYNEATTQFQHALKKEPNYLIPRYHLGVSQLAQGQTDTAFQTFQEYARLTVDDARPYIEMGHVYRKKGKVDQAIEAYQKALEISTVEAEAHYQLAYLYKQQKNNEKAVRHLKTVLRLQPDHEQAEAIQKDIQALSQQ